MTAYAKNWFLELRLDTSLCTYPILRLSFCFLISYDLSFKSFSNLCDNSCEEFIILNTKSRFTCGNSWTLSKLPKCYCKDSTSYRKQGFVFPKVCFSKNNVFLRFILFIDVTYLNFGSCYICVSWFFSVSIFKKC